MLAVGSGFTLLDPIVSSVGKPLAGMLGSSLLKGEPVTTTIHIFLTLIVFIVAIIMAKRASQNFAVKLDEKLNARTFFEIILDGVMGLMEDQMGKKNARRFFPLISTLAIFILFSNALALVPGMVPPTDNLNTTLAPALVVLVATHYAGFKANGIHHITHLFGPIKKWYALPLMLLFFGVETLSHFIIRPGSLALRLFGNMTADHSVLGEFVDLAPFIVPIPVMMLGCVVVIVQTLVFCLLSVIYISLALEHDEEGH